MDGERAPTARWGTRCGGEGKTSGGDLGPWPEPIPECLLGWGQLDVEVSLLWPPWV